MAENTFTQKTQKHYTNYQTYNQVEYTLHMRAEKSFKN